MKMYKAKETGTVLTKEGVINIKNGQFYSEECYNANKSMFVNNEKSEKMDSEDEINTSDVNGEDSEEETHSEDEVDSDEEEEINSDEENKEDEEITSDEEDEDETDSDKEEITPEV